MKVRTLTLVAAVAVLLAACAALLDATPPDVSLSVRANDIVKVGDTITVTALDGQSGIASVAVDFDGANLLLRTIPEGERDQQAVTFEVTVERDLVLGEVYVLEVEVVNGVGLSRELTVPLVAGAAGDVAAPIAAGPVVQWVSPAPGSSVPGVIELTGRATATAGLDTVSFIIENESGAVPVAAVDAGGGLFTYTWIASDWPAGDYTITFAARDAEGVSRDVKVKLVVQNSPDGAPSLAFRAPSPTPGQRVAGFVSFEVAFDAPRGFASAEVLLVAADLGANQVPFTLEVVEGMGVLRGRFLSLELEEGEYILVATVVDATGDSAIAELVFEIRAPYVITNPVDEQQVGLGAVPFARQIVAIAVGVNGTVRDRENLSDLTVTSADVFINGEFLANAVVDDSASDNRIVIYGWDTAVDVVGVHDAAASGDRVITVRIQYSYVDDQGETVNGSRFTPGVLVDFQP